MIPPTKNLACSFACQLINKIYKIDDEIAIKDINRKVSSSERKAYNIQIL